MDALPAPGESSNSPVLLDSTAAVPTPKTTMSITKHRCLIICFDGTSNQFDDDVSTSLTSSVHRSLIAFVACRTPTSSSSILC